MGLGLIICKGLVEAHGGRIRAESGGIGQGARFTFTVPVAEDARRSESAGPRTRPAATPQEPREPARVLVVDDDPQTLRYVRDTLTAAGYAAVVTGDHAHLSRTIRTERPHLVLLDLVLPGADGIALMGGVPELADLPVVFISGYGRDETIAQALKAGAADYLVKPFSPTELTARVDAALRRVARPEPFALGGLAIHYEERRVTVAGRPDRADRDRVRASARALRSTPDASSPTIPCCARSGAGAGRATSTWCATSSRSSARSSATTRRARPGYSACAGSATACRTPATPDGPPVLERFFPSVPGPQRSPGSDIR